MISTKAKLNRHTNPIAWSYYLRCHGVCEGEKTFQVSSLVGSVFKAEAPTTGRLSSGGVAAVVRAAHERRLGRLLFPRLRAFDSSRPTPFDQLPHTFGCEVPPMRRAMTLSVQLLGYVSRGPARALPL
jgi:hypothetical protein